LLPQWSAAHQPHTRWYVVPVPMGAQKYPLSRHFTSSIPSHIYSQFIIRLSDCLQTPFVFSYLCSQVSQLTCLYISRESVSNHMSPMYEWRSFGLFTAPARNTGERQGCQGAGDQRLLVHLIDAYFYRVSPLFNPEHPEEEHAIIQSLEVEIAAGRGSCRDSSAMLPGCGA
jgi:hypothetical protein